MREWWRWVPHAAVGLIALPFVIDQNAWYEWANALWLLDLQTAHVGAHGLPTYFIDAPEQYFYPNFVFYGGTAFSVLAYPALVLGTWPVFAASTVAAFIATSAGIGWTARNLGVPPRLSAIPGVLFALTPYTVSNLYGRGAWSELIAVGALSVALGAATSLTSGRARNVPWTVAVLAGAVASIAGTHNITLLFSALLAPVLALALLPLLTGERRLLIRRHLLVLAGALTGIAVCGAFLIPDLWLSKRTLASTISHSFLSQLTGFDSFSSVFSPVLAQPRLSSATDLHTQTLVLPLVWLIVVSAVALRRRWLGRDGSLALALVGLVALALALLITHPAWWLSLPSVVQAIQFPFRLVSYLALVTTLGVIVLLRAPALRRSRAAMAALVLICGWQAGLALDLALTSKARGGEPHTAPSPANIRAGTVPTAFAAGLLQASQFRLVVARPLSPTATSAQVAPVGDDTPPQIVLSGSQAAATLVPTHVVASPLIQVSGQASFAGSTAEGFEVLRVGAHATPQWHARIGSACTSCLRALTGNAPLALLAGRVASVLGVLALLGWAIAGTRARTRPAGGREPGPGAANAVPASPTAEPAS